MKKIIKAFTLIELVIVIFVLCIIAVLAIPSFGHLLAKQRLNSDARSLASILTQSRNQAVFLRKEVQTKFVSGSNTETMFYWSKSDQNSLASPSTIPEIKFRRDGTLIAANADIEFKLCNAKIGISKHLILAKSGSIYFKADGTC